MHLTVNATADYSLCQVSIAAFCGALTIMTQLQQPSESAHQPQTTACITSKFLIQLERYLYVGIIFLPENQSSS